MLLLEGTSWEYHAREAAGRRLFKRSPQLGVPAPGGLRLPWPGVARSLRTVPLGGAGGDPASKATGQPYS